MAGLPHVDLSLDAQSNPKVLEKGACDVCRALLPAWAGLPDEDIQVTKVTGGISNALFKADPKGDLEAVLVRVYGLNTERFIDREKEVAIMRLVSDHGFGTKVLGTFATGRLEVFLPQKCLSPDQLKEPAICAAIGRALQNFHTIPGPGKKEPCETPFTRIHDWLDLADSFTFDDPKKQAEFDKFDLADLRQQVLRVQAACEAVGSPAVFAHNDLLAGNVMVADALWADLAAAPLQAPDGKDSLMTFIDFEYADWAPRGFDWGNHFNEYAGFDGDYTQYPTAEEASVFLRAYLASERGVPETGVPDADVAAAVVEADLFSLASHMYWGAWCFLQAQWSILDFDYLEYAHVRWGECARRLEGVLQAAAGVFPRQVAGAS